MKEKEEKKEREKLEKRGIRKNVSKSALMKWAGPNLASASEGGGKDIPFDAISIFIFTFATNY